MEEHKRPFRPLTDLERDALLQWFKAERRILPWREDPSPYRVWVSEIMLQQTRVDTVIPYFEHFMEVLPDIPSLASADGEILLKLWEGLGYYSRVRNLQKAAVVLTESYGGKLPSDVGSLLRLPGIGPYTAGAIASIAFGKPEPAVDGNVLRVLARLSGYEEDIRKPEARKEAENAVRRSMPERDPGTFTQALMEIGALVCVPNGEAKCGCCPFCGNCFAENENKTDVLPFRSDLPERKKEDRTVLILLDGDKVSLRRRPPKGLLAGLYELPNAPGRLDVDRAVAYARKIGFDPVRTEILPEAVHLFSHVEWHMTGWLMTGSPDEPQAGENGLLSVTRAELDGKYAVPSAFAAYLKILRERMGAEKTKKKD
ncbi:MAG: A/G-specific adenine glycosylase [Clostridia bacterium]|nr:A/G-specific adenine glycosylase [Clostridia bacterium]